MSRPTAYGQRVTSAIRLDPELHARLKEAADVRTVSVNWLITRAIEQLLDNIEGQPLTTRTPPATPPPSPEPDVRHRRRWGRRR